MTREIGRFDLQPCEGPASYLPEGWYALVDELCTAFESKLGPEGCVQFDAKQLKEKFGGLRFYFALDGAEDRFFDFHTDEGLRTLIQRADGPPVMDALRELVALAAQASQVTCQKCGAPGKRRLYKGWLATLCERHLAELNAQGDAEEGGES